MKFKAILVKIINPFLLIFPAVLMFVHLWFNNDRDAWYCRDVEKNLSLICAISFIYRTRKYKHGLLNVLYKCAFSFIFLKCSFNLAEELIAWIYVLHYHKQFLLAQSFPLSIICFIAVFYLLGANKWLTEFKQWLKIKTGNIK